MHFSHLGSDGTARFHLHAPDAREVRVAASFLGWDSRAMNRTEHGWFLDLHAGPGEHEYKLVIDGRWGPDPKNLRRGRDDNSLLSSERGSITHLEFHSPSLGERRGYVVHLPPGHDSGRRFPTLYLLHGALDWERTWMEKGGLAETLDRLRHELIVVMPNENGGMFRNEMRVADYLSRDLVGHVDFEFPTLTESRHRALDGLSTGGFTSIILGAWRPNVFGSIGSMSGCHDARTFEAISACASQLRGQRYLVSAGHGEPHIGTCHGVHDALRHHGIDSSWTDAPGIHDWPLWREMLPRHLGFHATNLR